MYLFYREFSKEKERVENLNEFMEQRRLELEAESRKDWVDVGEQLAAIEAAEKRTYASLLPKLNFFRK